MDVKKIFGSNVKLFRSNLGIKQSELSKRIDVSTETVSQIERGLKFVTADTLERLCKEFRCNPEDLFKIR